MLFYCETDRVLRLANIFFVADWLFYYYFIFVGFTRLTRFLAHFIEVNMVTAANTEWVADVVTMTCKNTTNNIVVSFEKSGSNLKGKITNLPLELIKSWAIEKRGEMNIRNAILEAEEVFLRVYFNNK
jgi:hypothetical protein